jgi:hypothetical protein
MNPKKKSRRYRVSVSIQALDLAISRFTHSLGLGKSKLQFLIKKIKIIFLVVNFFPF